MTTSAGGPPDLSQQAGAGGAADLSQQAGAGGAAGEGSDLPKKAGARWSGRSRGGYIGHWIFVNLARVMGLRAAYLLLVPVAFYFLFFAPRAMRASRAYRRRAARALEQPWLNGAWAAYRHFFSFGQILLDRVAIISQPPGRFSFEFDGEHHLREAVARGRGLILVSGHVGNWEVAAHLLRRIDAPVNVVAFKAEEDYARQHFSKAGHGRVQWIAMDGTADVSLAIMSALARGEVVAMHADRSLNARPEHTVAVPFLGDPARFPVGPYVVAASSRAPLIHTFAVRQGLYRYRFHAYPPEYLEFQDRAGRREALRRWTERFVERLEETLKQHPLQWHNFYDFWDDEAGGAAAGGAATGGAAAGASGDAGGAATGARERAAR